MAAAAGPVPAVPVRACAARDGSAARSALAAALAVGKRSGQRAEGGGRPDRSRPEPGGAVPAAPEGGETDERWVLSRPARDAAWRERGDEGRALGGPN